MDSIARWAGFQLMEAGQQPFCRAIQIASPVVIQAVAGALHVLWLLVQTWRQVLHSSQGNLAAHVVHQLDPASMQVEHLRHFGRSSLQRLVSIQRAV